MKGMMKQFDDRTIRWTNWNKKSIGFFTQDDCRPLPSFLWDAYDLHKAVSSLILSSLFVSLN